ncbi:transcriptional regulator [Burkholderia lata]|uniref:helix-turn-helix domain-containing protein n=1 Tax=Burkholderia lata (strain ATCC 17760 / DSM 23089 / LMG 22485 / NCIMB 9086 / R18194 / 383) TaxID=482957 RepID=UPI0014549B74|nr:XRE family transcriptional regulator [Burkholderia lata]VWD31704.1 transcriptional regulator [Burkholderia lata]
MSKKTRVASILSALPLKPRRREHLQVPADQIGQRLRALRQSRDLTLNEASQLTGVPAATFSRIETNKMSPTFGVLHRIIEGMGFDWRDVLTNQPRHRNSLSVCHADDIVTTPIANIPYEYALLHRDSSAGMITLRMQVDARTVDEAGGLAGHEGDEFCYVLSGELELHFEHGEPTRLRAGESALFSSHRPHAYVAPSPEGATLLVVLTPPAQAPAKPLAP